MGTAIQIRSLSTAFSHCKALQEVCLDVDAGEMVALIGASGSGKSTLLRHIAGFVAADAGEITVLGQAIQQDGRMSANVRQLRAGIGFVFQQFNLVGRLSVMTNVLTGLLRQVRQLCRPEGADAVLAVCGVPEVIPLGIEMIRVGGTYVLGGVVNPKAMVTIDANQVLRKLLTLRGVHNYHPRNLIEALDFVVANRRRFPLHDMVDGKYPLDRVGEAMADAAAGRVLRAAIVP